MDVSKRATLYQLHLMVTQYIPRHQAEGTKDELAVRFVNTFGRVFRKQWSHWATPGLGNFCPCLTQFKGA